MRHRFVGGACLALAAVLSGAAVGRAQQGYDSAVPGNSFPTIPIPTGQAGQAGFYGSAEFMFLTQTKTVGDQTVAFRGLVDSSGRVTGVPGTYIGSGQAALTTDHLTRVSFQPGYRVEIGYRLDDGTRLYGNFMQLFDVSYSAGATLAAPFARSRPDLTDTFLVSGVYNFPPQFAGPQRKTAYDVAAGDPGFNTYGIWNGASVTNIKYTQRFTTAELGARMPMFQTEYSRVYGIGGAKYAWFFERFQWYTGDFALNGNAGPQDQAFYTNTLSQRMYGPMLGCGHEIFVANQFSLSLDLTGALLIDYQKTEAKYKLGDVPGDGGAIQRIQSKANRRDWSLVPNANAELNLWWYPIEGVQLRVGYQGQAYFNTRGMRNPIGFDYSAPDPLYNWQFIRVVHGINAGIAFFF